MYDYYLGGKDNFAADRELAEQVLKVAPNARATARANRNFLVRVTEAVAMAGIRQFVDLGTGIPTSPNVHEVAQQIKPCAHVAYVDNDPIVLSHARALLAGTRSDVIAMEGDLRAPEQILDPPPAACAHQLHSAGGDLPGGHAAPADRRGPAGVGYSSVQVMEVMHSLVLPS
ncbi:SAM-dependent methyltransferase [Nonomuraea antimicrobica]|uniref:SAM-dependent methyltransferase n=1 Tax=Nonomuraea antimicrobica TaxID=561173 RepID=UPI0031E87256